MSAYPSHILLLLSIAVTVVVAEKLQGITWMKKRADMSGFTREEQQFMVDTHNAYRRAVAKGQYGARNGATNMRELTWSDALARDAQRWADNCGGPMHNQASQRGYSGQNYVGYSDRTGIMQYAFEGWCDKEVGLYRYGTKNGQGKYEYLRQGSGHYTQVVWARSNEVGCGYSQCSGHAYGRVVCHYMIGGNFYEVLVYEAGRECSNCDAGFGFCNDGLCSKQCQGRNCVCKVDAGQCQRNGGTFDSSRCFCKCPAGKKGLNCEKPCSDNDKGVFCNKDHCRRGSQFYHQMEAFCDKTCGQCVAGNGGSSGGGGGSSGDRDNHPNCPSWAARGECQANPGWMLKNCKKSCRATGGGGSSGDRDNHPNCPSWAERGECRANPGWMLKNCKKSCRGH